MQLANLLGQSANKSVSERPHPLIDWRPLDGQMDGGQPRTPPVDVVNQIVSSAFERGWEREVECQVVLV